MEGLDSPSDKLFFDSLSRPSLVPSLSRTKVCGSASAPAAQKAISSDQPPRCPASSPGKTNWHKASPARIGLPDTRCAIRHVCSLLTKRLFLAWRECNWQSKGEKKFCAEEDAAPLWTASAHSAPRSAQVSGIAGLPRGGDLRDGLVTLFSTGPIVLALMQAHHD